MSATPVRAQARRREVVVNGRRVKTVEVHAHRQVPDLAAQQLEESVKQYGLRGAAIGAASTAPR